MRQIYTSQAMGIICLEISLWPEELEIAKRMIEEFRELYLAG